MKFTDLDAHRVDVDFLVKIVEKSDSLHNHGVDLVGRKLELEPIMISVLSAEEDVKYTYRDNE